MTNRKFWLNGKRSWFDIVPVDEVADDMRVAAVDEVRDDVTPIDEVKNDVVPVKEVVDDVQVVEVDAVLGGVCCR